MNDASRYDLPEGATLFLQGCPLPSPMREIIVATGSTGMVNLPRQIFVTALSDYRASDEAAFSGPAQFRVGLARSFIILSLSMRTLNFDVIWSPVIAAQTGEPNMIRPSGSEHLLFNFILAYGEQVIRSIRQATISPECAIAIWRAQQEMSSRNVTSADLEAELHALFKQYPVSIPETFFHATCNLGD